MDKDRVRDLLGEIEALEGHGHCLVCGGDLEYSGHTEDCQIRLIHAELNEPEETRGGGHGYDYAPGEALRSSHE